MVILQISDPNGIQHQAYFYGFTSNQPGGGLSNYARAIDVMPGSTPIETRIAVCGDTFDEDLPRSTTDIYTGTNSGQPTGFIALFRGDGVLLWSYHLFGEDTSAATGVTDVVIEHDAPSDLDIITYCGCSTNGNYNSASGLTTTMAPLAAFQAPVAACTQFAGGDTHNAPSLTTPTNNWDGFVGQIRRSHSLPHSSQTQPPIHRQWHSIVGGSNRDTLFAIARIGPNRYIAVGTLLASMTNTTLAFPLTRPFFGNNPPICEPLVPLQAPTHFGIAIAFDTSPAPASPISILASTIIGSIGSETTARDVLVLGGSTWIVGSTNDPQLAASVGNGFQDSFVGSTQGYVVGSPDFVSKSFDRASFLPSGEDSAAIGIAGFSDFPDHLAIVGWRLVDGNKKRIQVNSVFVDTTAPAAPLRHIRQFIINKEGGSNDVPGTWSAPYPSLLTASPGISTGGQASMPQGGAVAVDERGLITIVGSTAGASPTPYPFTGPMPGATRAGIGAQPGHGTTPIEPDAVLTIVDMLPQGVCRTDGTGACFTPWTRASGSGGTTPSCALQSNGGPIGRMLVDVEGSVQGGLPVSVLVDRPPGSPSAALWGGVLQIGFPSNSPTFPLGPGVEIWGGTTVPAILTYTPSPTSLREPLWTVGLPPGPQQFTIQFVSLMLTPVCPGIDWVASPALMVGYSN